MNACQYMLYTTDLVIALIKVAPIPALSRSTSTLMPQLPYNVALVQTYKMCQTEETRRPTLKALFFLLLRQLVPLTSPSRPRKPLVVAPVEGRGRPNVSARIQHGHAHPVLDADIPTEGGHMEGVCGHPKELKKGLENRWKGRLVLSARAYGGPSEQFEGGVVTLSQRA